LNLTKSNSLFQEAQKHIPGGVNSPVRAYKAVGGNPPFIESAQGSKIFDVDGNEYIDYVGSWGPMILGHIHPNIIGALEQALKKGTSYGAPTQREIELATLVLEAYPSMDMVRMVSSGTEATMSAIRVARGYTRRNKVIKFEGCYHGHTDGLLVKAGSGATTLGVPDSLGVPEDFARNTYTAIYNDLSSVKELLEKDGDDIACLIVEGVPGNMGVIPPSEGFLEGLRELTTQHGVLLIFDEVMSGFRVSFGGAQQIYNIKPDLTCLGKIIGGGMPVGAFGGRRDIMELLAPLGPVYQAGTLSGNPLAMTAGIETLKLLKDGSVYNDLEEKASYLTKGLKDIAEEIGIPAYISRVGSMFTLFFKDGEVKNYEDARSCDLNRFSLYFQGMLGEGIYLPASQFEAVFISHAHSEEDLSKTLNAAKKVLDTL
jgi:glutamate-1-semialdehyde 2,1-aminomutase